MAHALLSVSLRVLACVAATEPPASQPTTTPATQPAFTLGDVQWLAGHWEGPARRGGVLEEHWSAPRAGVMMGMFRMVTDDGETLVIELEALRETPAGVDFVFRHFAADLRPWEDGQPAPLLRLTRADGKVCEFTNPAPEEPRQNQPHRVTLERLEPDVYRSRVTVLRNGEEAEIIDTQMRRKSGGRSEE